MQSFYLKLLTSLIVVFSSFPAHAQDSNVRASEELVRLAWAASSQNDLAQLNALVEEALKGYEAKARALHAELTNFPARDQMDRYKALSDVATILFIKAEALMRQGKKEEATALFQSIIDNYKWSQSWDPSRGGYWSVAEKSKASIDVMMGLAHQEQEKPVKQVPRTIPVLATPGKDKVVDYTKYGQYLNVGTKDFHYSIKDTKALSEAVGEGIYPNATAVYKNPGYKKAQKEKRLEGSHWDYTNTEDLEAAFYKWATAPEPWGVRLFYIGLIFERAKMYHEALKAYHALIVHYPSTTAWTYWQTPWYPAQAAISKIKHIIREHPELNLTYKWGKIKIVNSSDNDPKNDIVITKPGIIRTHNFWDSLKEGIIQQIEKSQPRKVKRTLGIGRVQLTQYDNGHWQMLVDQKPFTMRGMTYAPTKVGQSPDAGTLANWMEEDLNKNGLIDGPYDSWVDKNKNNKQDSNEPVVGDFQLMKEMGVNTLRIYHQASKPNKELLRKMHADFGFMVAMGDYLGKYTLGSGASWHDGTDYENEVHKKNMMESVKQMVMEHKDEPYILLWILGNENNYGVASNADKKPEAYYKFVNEVARMIKSIDPNHPVALCNGDTLYLDIFAANAPEVDLYAGNVYRGDYGFGSFWEQVQDATDKPAFITEFGAPAYGGSGVSLEDAEKAQAQYHRGNWLDIEHNLAGYKDGVGNAVGGIVFEWMDEWWKNYEPALHDKKSDVIGPFPGGYYYEEWFGLIAQGDGKNSPYLRQPRKVYYTYKELWK